MAEQTTYTTQPSRKGSKKTVLTVVLTILVGLIYFYFNLPAINLHAKEFYVFIFILCAVYIGLTLLFSGEKLQGGVREYLGFVKRRCLLPGILVALLVVIFLVGTLLSSVIIRARSYHELLPVTTGDFAQDVDEISYDKIPMLDETSAEQLGKRKLGELSDMVSQFEISSSYTQINYQGRPVRVTYLRYGDFFKWFSNMRNGLPAYMLIDMTTQEVDVVRLPEGQGIKYSPSEYFFRNLNRHLRLKYPTFMFATPTFEIDENGTPYWVCSKIEKTIGLFGGTDINGAVLVNAVTGESQYYEKEDVPTWVDRVYPSNLIIEQYDYYGTYGNGFLNSLFGQKGVTVSTDGYNYIALNDDVYLYTGVTSVTSDQSNIGFILSNQRTKETKYYSSAGATEYSAMASAEGVVQHLNYMATFPLLLNIDGQPTYFIALKDNANLVKLYAMVNEQQYQIVATGASVAACESAYLDLMAQHGITDPSTRPPVESGLTVTGTIVDIRTAVIDGNSYYYFKLDSDDRYFSISASSNQTAIILNKGDAVTLRISAGTQDSSIVSILSLSLPQPEPAEPKAE